MSHKNSIIRRKCIVWIELNKEFGDLAELVLAQHQVTYLMNLKLTSLGRVCHAGLKGEELWLLLGVKFNS